MTNLDIKINIKKLSDYSALSDRSKRKKTLLLIEAFSYYVKDLYLRLIEEAIYSRRYKGNWEPVDDPGYQEYLGTEPVGNILSLIEEALEVKKLGNNFYVRFNPKYKYPGTKLPLIKVLRAIDNGTSDFNARPIFSRIVRDINRYLISLWKGYLAQRGVVWHGK